MFGSYLIIPSSPHGSNSLDVHSRWSLAKTKQLRGAYIVSVGELELDTPWQIIPLKTFFDTCLKHM